MKFSSPVTWATSAACSRHSWRPVDTTSWVSTPTSTVIATSVKALGLRLFRLSSSMSVMSAPTISRASTPCPPCRVVQRPPGRARRRTDLRDQPPGVRSACSAVKQAGVARFLFSSSCSNYGASGGTDLLDEESELRPLTAYGRSKVLVEQDVERWPTIRSARRSSATPPSTASRRGSGWTSWSTTSSRGRLPRAKSGSQAMALRGDRSSISRIFAGLFWSRWRRHVSACTRKRSTSAELRELPGPHDRGTSCRDRSELTSGAGIRRVAGCPQLPCELREARVDARLRPAPGRAAGVKEHYEAYLSASLSLDDLGGPGTSACARSSVYSSEMSSVPTSGLRSPRPRSRLEEASELADDRRDFEMALDSFTPELCEPFPQLVLYVQPCERVR